MIDLSDTQLETVKKILHQYVPDAKVRVFGSRVKGTARKFSDLDLAVDNGAEIDLLLLSNLDEAFAESDLPIKVDVVDWHLISNEFQQHILKHYIELE